MRPIITSVKHYVQIPIAAVAMGAINNQKVITSVAQPTLAVNVLQGSVVKAVYVEIWLLAGAMDEGSFTLAIEKKPSQAPDMTAAEGADLFNYTNKKNILYTTQGIIGDQNTNPVPVIRTWIKIPKGKQRFGFGDEFVVNILANLESLSFCGLVVFKEYN